MNDEVTKVPGKDLKSGVFVEAEDLVPEFRVVARGDSRRGIRLEHYFWKTLKQIAENQKSTIGKLVDDISEQSAETGNLASAIRVACLRSVTSENIELKSLSSLKTINAILAACPSPAFALSASKQILTFNPAFQQFVRRHLPIAPSDDARPDLRLTLDLQVAEIFARFDASDSPVSTGFVIGANDRRYRGQLNVVRAPLREPELLLAFVFSG